MGGKIGALKQNSLRQSPPMAEAMEQEQRRCWDFLRVAAQLLVVLGHVGRFYGGTGVMTTSVVSEGVRAMTELIYNFHMPLYMLVSGCVYAACRRRGKYEHWSDLFVNKTRRLIVPYFLWGIFYVAPVLVICGLTSDWFTYITSSLLIGDDCRHLWFLLSLFWIFLWVRAIEPWGRRHPVLCAGLSLLLWGLSVEPHGLPLRINLAMTYQLHFWIGIWFSDHYDRLAPILRKYWWLAAVFFLPLLLNPSSDVLNLLIGLSGCLMALMLTVKLAPCLPRLERSRVYRWIKEFTFPLYLVHPMIFYLVVYYTGSRGLNPWAMTLGLTAAVYGGFLLFWALRERFREKLHAKAEFHKG